MDFKVANTKLDMRNLIATGTVILIILIMGAIPYVPWWLFTLPVFLLGIIAGLKKWNIASFLSGFGGGFIAWFGGSFYYGSIKNPVIIGRVASLMGLPPVVVLTVSGIIGGVLAGLALYSGKKIFSTRDVPSLES